jgi:hypothetical protein
MFFKPSKRLVYVSVAIVLATASFMYSLNIIFDGLLDEAQSVNMGPG